MLQRMGELEVVRRRRHGASGHGGDRVGRDLLIAGHLLHAALDESAHGSGDLGLVKLKTLLGVSVERGGDERLIAATQAIAQDVQHADGRTAQREGVLGAGRRLADGEHAGDGVELVGNGDDAAGRALGQGVTGEARAIVVADGGGDLGCLSGGRGVVAAHHALLARELDDGRGHEVRFRQVRSALGVAGRIGADARLAGDGKGEVLHAIGLLQHRAEFLLEADLGQARAELLKVDLEVLVIEELGVVQAGREPRARCRR